MCLTVLSHFDGNLLNIGSVYRCSVTREKVISGNDNLQRKRLTLSKVAMVAREIAPQKLILNTKETLGSQGRFRSGLRF